MSTIAGSLVCLVRLAGVKSAGPIGISLLMALLATLAVGKDSYSDARCERGAVIAIDNQRTCDTTTHDLFFAGWLLVDCGPAML